jgi:hypothetical protein
MERVQALESDLTEAREDAEAQRSAARDAMGLYASLQGELRLNLKGTLDW